eukprot:Plantae.Rhodophyta-Hildenbrandia_rubra.ctg26537.p1 GENE.Plantae.Rhodophyta-Hildenbrandia_rubra.ctg26537~~Plantae.Rhodophyta-Hildenbrandia_rubra.ctg26537.p1  ORF type:complete len:325 (-),score=22.85 Plantae.Rhodophyta-Hildenbrandia_rubra.ctg26537:29-1003(-)
MAPTLISKLHNLHISDLHFLVSQNFRSLQISGILSLLTGTIETYPDLLYVVNSHNISHHFVDINDEPTSDLLSQLPACLSFLNLHCKPEGTGALIHCNAGLSRSAAVACAYLMMHHEYPGHTSKLQGALHDIRKVRAAHPNEGFMKQLQIFEEAGCDVKYTSDGDGDVNRLPFRSELQHRLTMIGALSKDCETPHIPDRLLPSNPFTKKLHSTTKYSCRRCRTSLATDRHIFEPETASTTTTLQVIPIKWMKQSLEASVQGRLNCPKCDAKVGSFSWKRSRDHQQQWCPCSLRLSSLDYRSIQPHPHDGASISSSVNVNVAGSG